MLTETELTEQIIQHLSFSGFASLLSLLTTWLAWQYGFFQKPCPLFPMVKGIEVLRGFALFLAFEIFIVPSLIALYFWFVWGQNIQQQINDTRQGWFNILAILGGFIGVMMSIWLIPHSRRKLIWGDHLRWYRDFFMGIISWFVSYPLVLVLGQVISIAVLIFSKETPSDQTAVLQLKRILNDSLLSKVTILAIITLVPIIEECLFRGLLQSWLKYRIKSYPLAILITSLIFSLFHYSPSQGITNIELLFSLFLLSCFLGYIYERQHSLWAPIGLHAFFNAMSVLMITQS